ncbi:methyltransferase domain-containing protein [Belnapia moabensis]|uniref:methyltransferase domain-containing protein n=1 Tax=Belnapia moabensis TaxID=365533 RepID=UPI0009FBC734
MIAAARQRCGGYDNLRFAVSSGHDLAGVADVSCDLVLAVNVFPYLVAGGMALAARHVAEAGRVLRSGGSLVILNFIPNPTDQNRCAQSRSPMDMIVQGCSTRRFQARQQWSTMSS